MPNSNIMDVNIVTDDSVPAGAEPTQSAPATPEAPPTGGLSELFRVTGTTPPQTEGDASAPEANKEILDMMTDGVPEPEMKADTPDEGPPAEEAATTEPDKKDEPEPDKTDEGEPKTAKPLFDKDGQPVYFADDEAYDKFFTDQEGTINVLRQFPTKDELSEVLGQFPTVEALKESMAAFREELQQQMLQAVQHQYMANVQATTVMLALADAERDYPEIHDYPKAMNTALQKHLNAAEEGSDPREAVKAAVKEYMEAYRVKRGVDYTKKAGRNVDLREPPKPTRKTTSRDAAPAPEPVANNLSPILDLWRK